MSNAPFACPHCRGAMSLPAQLVGLTVSCPHCKMPFQVPAPPDQNEPALDPSMFAGPRPRRSLDRTPAGVRWMWIVLATVFAGMLLAVVLFLRPKGGLTADLNKARINQLYERIKPGTPEKEALKYARELMAEFPGELKEDEQEEEGIVFHTFEKGQYKLIVRIHPGTVQVTPPVTRVGF